MNNLKLTILITTILMFGLVAQVQADCAWTKVTLNPDFNQELGTCDSSPNTTKGTDDQCPAGKPDGNQNVRYDCCCSTAPHKAVDLPKFIMPDIQITIPGLTLTPSSTLKTTVEDDGSVSVGIPWISEYLLGIYNYSLSIAGILAALVLMAGGILWLISAGDSSKITQSKELIAGSITGLMILFCSYIILYTINPNLTIFKSIQAKVIADLEPASSEGNPNNTTDCQNCTTLNSNIPYKNGNQVNTSLNDKLAKAFSNSGDIKWRVTEAYPPSSTHQSKCHYNGACVDVALTSTANCDNVNKFIEILKAAGLKTLNEYMNCNGTKTTYTTGGHVHVQ
jgi:hypothetical protein